MIEAKCVMPPISSELIETLLNMSEGETLDFKRDPYPLDNATDEQKSEFVKDVLAFANAWKAADAYILIGVDEVRGARSNVVGVASHPNDATLQQLVNAKTNAPVRFEYTSATFEGKSLGVVIISKVQERPIFLKKRFGKLNPNVVYVRRGSSTAEADPSEVARMGAARVLALEEPQLVVELADPETRTRLGEATTVTSTLLKPRPPAPPGALERAMADISKHTQFLASIASPPSLERLNQPDPEELQAYRKEVALLKRIGFWLKNTGPVLIKDARITLKIHRQGSLQVTAALPERPLAPITALAVSSLSPRFSPPPELTVDALEDSWEITAYMGKVQPHAEAWSEPFWLGAREGFELQLVAHVFADNLPKPLNFPCRVEVRTQHGWLGEEDEDDE